MLAGLEPEQVLVVTQMQRLRSQQRLEAGPAAPLCLRQAVRSTAARRTGCPAFQSLLKLPAASKSILRITGRVLAHAVEPCLSETGCRSSAPRSPGKALHASIMTQGSFTRRTALDTDAPPHIGRQTCRHICNAFTWHQGGAARFGRCSCCKQISAELAVLSI